MKNFILLISSALFGFTALAALPEPQRIASKDGAPLPLYVFKANATAVAPAPTLLALHGCSGMLNLKCQPTKRVERYGELFTKQGWNVVYMDSFSGRGVKTICGEGREGGRSVTQAQRVEDVQQALAWLAKQGFVNAKKIAIIGWSNGGTTSLRASEKGLVLDAKPVATVSFYPGCGPGSVSRTWQPAHPILMQLGALDDWTAPEPCQAIAAKWASDIKVDTYAGSYHGFDGDSKLMQLKNIISRTTGQPVHLGGNPVAQAASEKAIIAFLQQQFAKAQ